MYNQQNKVKWSFGWMNDVDPQRLTLFPIQLANCRRLEHNNAVYLFDEVGSGKTLSSGMMALHYLYHLTHETLEKPQKAKNKKDVLVITTNALCRPSGSSENGQFLDDWFQKLPFERLGYTNKIEARNHHYSHYQKNTHFKLVIIDEAHLFLNRDSLRFQNLCENICTDKVIFLTATPIKSDQAKDLQTYVKIAERITGDFDSSWIEQLNTIGKENKDIISCGFDPKLPVSRYFKETITALTTTKKVQRNCKRMPTELISYGLIEQNDENGNTSVVHIDKKEALLNYIEKHQNPEDRFVVFVRYVEQEAYELARFLSLEQNGFEQFKPFQEQNIQKSYAVVTGDNAYELHNYDQDIDSLPNVLILTYQIAEQGVNLPGFNHVINYHISQFPSALEQRYGRIDRIRKRQTEEEKEIYNCFLIRKNGYDTSTRNFRLATWNYIINILGNLPSKNAMLTPEMLNYILDDGKFLECYKQKVDEFLHSKKVEHLKTLLYNDYSQSQKDEEMDNYEDIENIEEKDDLTYEIYHFIKQLKLEWKPEDSWETFIDEICTEFIKELNQNINLKEKLKKKIPLIQNLLGAGGDVFYLYEPFRQIEENEYSPEDCARVMPLDSCKTMVEDHPTYSSFEEELHKECPLPFIRQLLKDTSVLDCWEKKFEDYFREGQFDSLFPIAGYQQCYGEALVEDAIEKIEEIDHDDRELIFENTEKIILDLPLFKMFDIFRKEIQDIYTKQGSETGILQQFTNPFATKMFGLKNKVWNLGLSKDFEEKYWNGGSVSDYNHFFEIAESDGKITAPEWLKLVYEYTRLEAAVVWGSNDSDGYFTAKKLAAEKGNIFFCVEENIRKYCQTSNIYNRQECCRKFLIILQHLWWKSYTSYKYTVCNETKDFVINFEKAVLSTEIALQKLKKTRNLEEKRNLINNCSYNMGVCQQIARNDENKEICYGYFQMIENHANELVQEKIDEKQWSKRAHFLEQFQFVMKYPDDLKVKREMFRHYFHQLYTANFKMYSLEKYCMPYESKGCSLFQYYSYVNSGVEFRTHCKQYKEFKLNQLNLEGVTDYWTRGIIHDLQKQNATNRIMREKYHNRPIRYIKDDASIKEFLDYMKSCYMGNFLELFD